KQNWWALARNRRENRQPQVGRTIRNERDALHFSGRPIKAQVRQRRSELLLRLIGIRLQLPPLNLSYRHTQGHGRILPRGNHWPRPQSGYQPGIVLHAHLTLQPLGIDSETVVPLAGRPSFPTGKLFGAECWLYARRPLLLDG